MSCCVAIEKSLDKKWCSTVLICLTRSFNSRSGQSLLKILKIKSLQSNPGTRSFNIGQRRSKKDGLYMYFNAVAINLFFYFFFGKIDHLSTRPHSKLPTEVFHRYLKGRKS